MRVLVIEDEAALREQLTVRLRAEGYAVDATGDGTEGLYLGKEYPIDVAVVDLGLPGALSGMDVIQKWREMGRTFPVLILTARGRWQDKVEGLESGADDYLVKPFVMEELLARLRVQVRRSQAARWPHGLLRCGPLALDMRARTVTANECSIELTNYEYRCLEHLMLNAGKVVSKSELTEHLYEDDMSRDSNVLEVLVARLRRKLDPNGDLNVIETRRGQGYRLRFTPDQD